MRTFGFNAILTECSSLRHFGNSLGGFIKTSAWKAATVEELARPLLSGLTADQQRDLRVYVSHLTGTLTPSEVKGVLNRATFDGVKFSSKGATELLRATAEQLSAAT